MKATSLTFAVVLVITAGCAADPEMMREPETPVARPSSGMMASTLLNRWLGAMGGKERLASLRSLEMHGTLQRDLPHGRTVEVKFSTFLRFPNKYRQELEMPGGTITTLFTPDGAWLMGPMGRLPLPEAQRHELERTLNRHPVMLLKARGQESFFVRLPGAPASSAETALSVSFAGEPSMVTLDPASLLPVGIEYRQDPIPGVTEGGQVRVSYSDYRTVAGLSYPFAVRTSVDGIPRQRYQLERVEVNPELTADLFEPEAALKADD